MDSKHEGTRDGWLVGKLTVTLTMSNLIPFPWKMWVHNVCIMHNATFTCLYRKWIILFSIHERILPTHHI